MPPLAASILGISPAQGIEQARRLLESAPLLAERQAREVLAVLPNDARALLIVGAARRRLGAYAAARDVLALVTAVRPDMTDAQRELGLTLAVLGDVTGAMDALRRAAIDLPAHVGADLWLQASGQFVLAGEAEAAWVARMEYMRAALHGSALTAAADALKAGRAHDAMAILRFQFRRGPQAALTLHLLAQAAFRLGAVGDAEQALAQCLALDPALPGARSDYAALLAATGRLHEALEQLAILRESQPAELSVRMLAVSLHRQAGDFTCAAELAAALVQAEPEIAGVWICHGEAQRHIGRADAAESAFRRAIVLRPAMGKAWLCLADMKTVRFTGDEISQLRAHLGNTAVVAENRMCFYHALASGLEAAAAWDHAFAAYTQAARIRRGLAPYDQAAQSARCANAAALFTPDFFASRGEGGAESAAPIFIVGLPRCGSTLVEQILAGHPDVEATLELHELGHIASRLAAGSAGDYATRIASLTPAQRTALGEDYLRRATRYCRLGRRHFIDKMLGNFMHVGLIRLILPHARIIDVRRHPMATCFSAYRQVFSYGNEFTCNLNDLGHYYKDYLALMRHFDRAMPGFVHRLIYEDLVTDTASQIRALLAFCGLPHADACRQFWLHDRPVATHSAQQVRLPMFSDGLDHWRHFSPWLEDTRRVLGDAAEAWR